MLRFVAALALSFAAANVLAIELDPPEPALGQTAVLRLDVAPADSTEIPTSTAALIRATADPLEFELRPVRVGEVAVVHGAEADTFRFYVAWTLEEADPSTLRPLHSIGRLAPNWWPTALLALLILTPLVGLLFWWLRRRGGRRPVFELPADPPHEIAMRRLAELEARGLPERGQFDRFYVEASHALREYVGGRFHVPALDWTREETLRRLLESGHEQQTILGVEPLLVAADEVKFARHAPTVHQAESWLNEARNWITGTAVEVVYTTGDAVTAAQAFNGRRSS